MKLAISPGKKIILMLINFLAFLSFFTFNAVAADNLKPKNDVEILHLSQASLICEVLKEVNPQAIQFTEGQDHFYIAVRLYSIFHNISFEEAEEQRRSWHKIFTNEPAIKAQSLRSIAGAQRYLNNYLNKTSAQSCNDISLAANRILSMYGYEL